LTKDHPEYARIDEALAGIARAEIQRDRTAPAAKSLDQLIRDHGKSKFFAEACFLRGTLYEKEDKSGKAEELYLRALESKPSTSLAREIQFRRVAVLQRQGRNADAATLMNDLIRDGNAASLPSPLLEWLARWNLEQKDYASAGVAAKYLAEIAENDGWRQLGNYIGGVAAREQNKKSEARRLFKAAADAGLNTRETALSFYELGRLAVADEKTDEAIAHFKSAAGQANADSAMDIRAQSYLQLGAAYEKGGDLNEAARHYMIVSVLYDDVSVTPESLFRAAVVQDALGQTKARDQSLSELRERYPDSEWSGKAAERWKF
jgi:TolA-binding protein